MGLVVQLLRCTKLLAYSTELWQLFLKSAQRHPITKASSFHLPQTQSTRNSGRSRQVLRFPVPGHNGPRWSSLGIAFQMIGQHIPGIVTVHLTVESASTNVALQPLQRCAQSPKI